MRVWTLPRIKCLHPVPPEPITFYTLYRKVLGRWYRASTVSYSNPVVASRVFSNAIAAEPLTTKIAVVRDSDIQWNRAN